MASDAGSTDELTSSLSMKSRYNAMASMTASALHLGIYTRRRLAVLRPIPRADRLDLPSPTRTLTAVCSDRSIDTFSSGDLN
jgi:hypothetical protein